MKISTEGLNLIKRFEGCHLKAYKAVATEKYYTIGYGHYGADVTQGMYITQQQAETYLLQDLSKAEGTVNSYRVKYYPNMTQGQYDALVSFTYNCGAGNLQKLTASGKRTTQEISDHITQYNKAGGKVLAGLTRRRKAEQELFNKVVVATKTAAGGKVTSVYYPKYTGKSTLIDVVMRTIGASADYDKKATGYKKRKPIATANGIAKYTGTAAQNLSLIGLAKKGVLKRV